MKSSSAFLIGGTASGSGKTTLTIGIMAALKARGLKVQPFKCGPDFIDPSLHRMVTGEISSNLDLRMCGKSFCEQTFRRRFDKKDVAVVEGVMGLFDGGIASSAALATELQLPVILVVDARSAAESVAAIVKGFESYAEGVSIAGVIFNRVGTPRHRQLIEEGMAGRCQTQILGFFPRDIRFTIPDRHLGLHMGDENPLDTSQLKELVAAIEKHIDLDLLLQISKCPTKHLPASSIVNFSVKEKVRFAVAKDAAFCFYYEDNLEMLSAAGAELVFFSPMSDKELPVGCKGIYFGGGYPELHAENLSKNDSMIAAVREFGHAGGIILAECGGFMYLCKEIETVEKQIYTMSGIFPFSVRMKARLSRLGYRKPELTADCVLGSEGNYLHGHEFHYSEIINSTEDVATVYKLDSGKNEGYTFKQVIGGYIHHHFARSTKAIELFIQQLKQSNITTS